MNPKPQPNLGIALAAALLVALPQVASAEQSNIQSATLGQNQKTVEVSTEELRRILMDGSATVFDARPFMEFASGHIPGAVNVSAKAGMPMSLYVSDVAEIERVVHGDKGGAIVLYCNGPFCGTPVIDASPARFAKGAAGPGGDGLELRSARPSWMVLR